MWCAVSGCSYDNKKSNKIGETHHVHFDAASLKDEYELDNSVTYQKTEEGILISLGFLQINHKYSIDLKLPTTFFGKIDESAIFVPDVSDAVPNLNCRIADFSGVTKDNDDFFEMKVEFFAYKEKLLRETLTVVNSQNCKEILKLVISARVLGKGKGTPMLRTGIHCIGAVKDDEESDQSDFSFKK